MMAVYPTSFVELGPKCMNEEYLIPESGASSWLWAFATWRYRRNGKSNFHFMHKR